MPDTASLPATSDLIRDLGVAWMNRGHELLQRNDAAALEAYSEAVVVLRRLPVAENPAWANSLGAALMNKGQLLHRLHGMAHATVALEAFDEAATLLRSLPAGENPWPRRNFAGTLLNRANLLLDLARYDEAVAAAQQALGLSAAHERTAAVDADLALKTRRVLCDAFGLQLVVPGTDQAALAAQASDLADDALALIRHWQTQEPAAFRELTARFFRFGARLYRLHQPHFLAEFIRENLPAGDAELRALALEVVDSALADKFHQPEFLTLGDPASERHVQTSRDLTSLRSSLAA